LTSLAGCDQQCNDRANLAVLNDLKLDTNLLVDAIATAESYLYTPEQLDFARQLDRSFLPDIVELAKENNIQLILVRTKHLDDPTEASESAALKAYIKALKAFAKDNDVFVLDFAHDEHLTSDLFIDSHHLSQAGRVVFTKMLAEALAPILKK
jgi:lysophospholipase L1-like esterase